MSALYSHPWQTASVLALAVLLIAAAAWLIFRKRPTAEELERRRRSFLSRSGRIADGMLLDICEVEAPEGQTVTLLLFNYSISGVDYECSQEITHMSNVVDVASVRPGFPCSVRYQPGNPHNSIVIAEEWSGLRDSLPLLSVFDALSPIDRSHLRSARR